MDLRDTRERIVREHMDSENMFRGVPPTGKSFECRMAAFFLFEDDRLVNERVYFDAATILTQLGLVGS
jgi:predicted ester cyclase